MLREIPSALATELRSLELRGPRGLEAAEAAASVTLAVLAALALHSDEPWWAGISAFMVTKASPLVAVPRAFMRVAGSVAGAVAALVVLRLFVNQSLPLCVSLFALSCIGTFGFVSSRNGYAWVVGTVTACLIILMSLDQPQAAFTTAVNRVAEVTVGTMASLVVCGLSPAPAEAGAAPAASLPDPPPLAFWRRRHGAELLRWLTANRPFVVHACRGGLTVMLMPALADWLAPVSPVTMGLTVVMIMSIPTTAILEPGSPAIAQRAVHRLVGCLIGALMGLACLALLADSDWDHGRQLYRGPGDVCVSDEHGAGPGPTRFDQPRLRAPGRSHGWAVGSVRRHADPVPDSAVPTLAGARRRQLTRRPGNGLINSRVCGKAGGSFGQVQDRHAGRRQLHRRRRRLRLRDGGIDTDR